MVITDSFWKEALNEDAIIVNGECYHDGGFVEHPSPYRFYGFGGRLFTIMFKDGRLVKTNNLWYNGVIPKEYGIEDNAVFI